MKILVTGGFGFIGSNLIRMLLTKTNFEITLVDAMTYAAQPDWVFSLLKERPYLTQRLTIFKTTVQEYAKGHRTQFDAIFHLAAESHVCNSLETPVKFLEANAVASFHLLEWVRQSTPRSKVIMVSTDEVFGQLGKLDPPFTLQHPMLPRSPYSATKAAADCFAMAYRESMGLNVTITNCSNNYGPNQHTEKLIPKTITRFLNHEVATIYGSGNQVRDWIHVDDHCDGLIQLLSVKELPHRVLFGGQTEATNTHIVQAIGEKMVKMGLIKQFTYEKIDARPHDDFRYAIALHDTKKILPDWKLRNFDEGLGETIRWYAERRNLERLKDFI